MPRKESSWHTMRRCLAIIRRVQRSPADRDTLIKAVLAQEGDEAYGRTAGQTLTEAFYKDMGRIRNQLRINLQPNRATGDYHLHPSEMPLLDLPDDALRTLAWLTQTFDAASPYHAEIQALVQQLRAYLAPERAALIERHQQTLHLDLARRDDNHIAAQTKTRLTQALLRGLQIEFDYYSSSSPDALPRRHLVDPYEQYFDSGHYYLKGWCHYTVSDAFGRRSQRYYFRYRLDRVENLALLSKRIPPAPRATRFEVTYQLNEGLARRGISRQRWIDFDLVQDVQPQPDGSVIVHGTTDDTFAALQSLIRYRGECEILGGSQMRRMMREAVAKMAAIYLTEDR